MKKRVCTKGCRVAFLLAVVAGLVLLAPEASLAIDAQNFGPAIGADNLIQLYTTTGLKQGQFGMTVNGGYAGDPLGFTYPDDTELAVIERQAMGEFAAYAGAFDWWTIGVAGSTVWVAGEDLDQQLNPDFPDEDMEADTGAGDMRAMMRFRILKNKKGSIGLALIPIATFPTGNPDIYAGAEVVNAGGLLALDKKFDRVNIVVNGGYLTQRDPDGVDEGLDPSGQARFGAGVSVYVHKSTDIVAEISGRTVDLGVEELEMEVPTEALLAGKFYAGPVSFMVGGGAGINSGVGNPAYRAFAGVGLTFPPVDRRLPRQQAGPAIDLDSTTDDTDRDGLTNYEETHTYRTDPLNPDMDGDGLKDGEEVKTLNTDPLKPDTDRDGLYDFEEVKVHKTDPLKPDTDGDTLVDGVEVKHYRTSPTLVDTDEDGVPDNIDGAPLEIETDNDIMDWDGVPEVLLARKASGVALTDAFLWIPPSLLAWTGTDKDQLDAASKPAIADAAAVLAEYPKVKVEVQGHVAFGTNKQFNVYLSTRRAQAIRDALVEAGTAADRITFRGYGGDFPVVPEDAPDALNLNNRIEIVITEQ